MTIRIVSVAEVTDLPSLESVALEIFGRGDRPRDWFVRKLRRECVDATLSQLALSDRHPPDDARSWIGYALVGTPPSMTGLTRTSGVGVLPKWRGQGVGRRLVGAAIRDAARRGYRAIHTPSTPELIPYYELLAFVRAGEQVTLLSFGEGRPLDDLPPADSTAWPVGRPWDLGAAAQTVEHHAWLPEAWEGTDIALRHTFHLGGVGIHVSREGQALAIHRVVAPPELAGGDVADRVDRFRAWAPEGKPVLLVLADTVSSITGELEKRGWAVVQRSHLMERKLSAADAAARDTPPLYKTSLSPR